MESYSRIRNFIFMEFWNPWGSFLLGRAAWQSRLS